MRRYWFLALAAAIVAAVSAPLTASATAAGVLTVGSGSGPAVASGDVLIGSLSGTALFTNTNGNEKVSCSNSSISATDVTNPVPPGQATENVNSMLFPPDVSGSCPTTGLFGATIKSIKTNASSTCPWLATIDDSPLPSNPATITISPNSSTGCSNLIEAVVKVQSFISFTCTYDAGNGTAGQTISGTASSTVSFSGVTFTGKSGNPGACIGPTALFTAAYTFVDQTQSNGTVVVN